MKIVYLGPKNTFTEKIARARFPNDDLVPLQPIKNVVLAIENGCAERGIIPIENFYNGHVIHTLDSLTKSKGVRIIEEISSRVIHCFGASKIHTSIKKIYSKDQALEQCDDYICINYPNAQTIQTSSTAEAAEYISKNNCLDSAAIASSDALIKSGLEVLAIDICPNNKTRFVILGKNQTISTGDDKTILAIHPPLRDEPGVLADCLNILKSQHINLECIYSRPDKEKGYFFYVELNGHEKDKNISIALSALKYSLDSKSNYEDTIKILGSFPNSHWKER